MDVTIEETSAFDRVVTIEIDAKKVEQLMDQELVRVAGSVKLPGFRPGKIPKKVLESRFREHVAGSVADQLFRESYPKALEENQLRAVNAPELDAGPITRGEPFNYKARIQIYPKVEPKGCTGLELTRKKAQVNEQDVDAVILNIRTERATFEAKPEQASMGDQIVLDFVGSINGETFPGGSAENHQLDLGKGQFIPGFEEQLVGCVAGEKKDVQVTFPEQYQAESLAGKEALFACTIQEVRARTLPPEDDALAQAAGLRSGGLVELRTEVLKSLQSQAESESTKQIKKSILDQIIAANTMDLPSQMVDQECQALVDQAKQEYQKQGLDLEKVGLTEAKMAESYQESAKDRVTLGLIMSALATSEKLEADEESIEAFLDEMSQAYGDQAAGMKKWVRSQKEQMASIKASVLEKKIIDWIIDHSSVTEETCTLDELMGKSNP